MKWILDISVCLDWFKFQGNRVIDNGRVSEGMAKTLLESRSGDRIHSVLDCVLSLKIDGAIVIKKSDRSSNCQTVFTSVKMGKD